MQHPSSAHEIMVTRLVTLAPSEPVFPAIEKLLQARITGAPVVGVNERYLGVFSEKCSLNFLMSSAQLADSTRPGQLHPTARDMMSTELFTLSPGSDAFDAITLLLARQISGAPVVDKQGRFLGVFSEKTSMSVLLGAAYDQLPSCRVEAFMDVDQGRVICEGDDLFKVAELFQRTHYRRLEVLRDGCLVGQISRRDALRAAMNYARRTPEAWDAARAGQGSLSDTVDVSTYMDTDAKTIPQDLDLLTVAQIFRGTPYRRLPVTDKGKLVGLVSRRDLLAAVNRMYTSSPKRVAELLYLSALDRDAAAAVG